MKAFDHILIIMFENQYRSYVMENEYFRGLAAQGIDMENYFGVMHPSQTNYIASLAGELCNVTDDDLPKNFPLPQKTVVDLIEASPLGLEWRAYMDSYIPQNQPWTPDLTPKDEYPYVIKHNPFSSFESVIRNEARWEKVVNEATFFSDLLNHKFPEYAWFTPNMWNDGHYLDGTQEDPYERAPALVDQAAVWLEGFFADLKFPGPDSHLPPNTLVVVTFDEADFEKEWDTGDKYYYDGPNQIYTVLLGDMIQPGVQKEGYNHYSLIKTIEHNFNLDTLGKNDTDANWFQFMWGENYNWGETHQVPVLATGAFDAVEYADALYVIFAAEGGNLLFKTYQRNRWSRKEKVEAKTKGDISLATCNGQIHCLYDDGKGISWLTYNLQKGWSKKPTQIVSGEVSKLDVKSFDYDNRMILVWSAGDGAIQSLVFSEGKWASAPVNTNFKTDGDLTLGVVGPSIYLIHKTPGHNYMNVVSYNTADFNVVSIEESKYSGSYDNTTVDKWSPSGFPVQHFTTAPTPVTPGEEEPLAEPYQGAGPLVASTLNGVIHLAHPGVSNELVLTETFSISGIMTPLNKVSYDPATNGITNNGYGTLAEAGWSEQEAIHGVYNRGNMAMATLGKEVVLLYQPSGAGRLWMCTGSYEG